MSPQKQKFAITILIMYIISFACKIAFGELYFFMAIDLVILYVAYITFSTILLFKEKITGWYMCSFYFGFQLVSSIISASYMFTDLITNSDANWGGLLSFLFPLPAILFNGLGVFLCLKSYIRQAYEIKL